MANRQMGRSADTDPSGCAQDHGTIMCHLPKETKGLHFADLDMLTKLLTVSKKKSPFDVSKSLQSDGLSPLIEVISSAVDGPDPDEEEGESATFEQYQTSDLPSLQIGKPRYGFNNNFEDFLTAFANEIPDLVQIQQADVTPESQRAGNAGSIAALH